MLRNYISVAIRSLLRQKGYAVINIAGLAVGMCCFLLIFLHVRDEFSYDKFHDKSGRIYRVTLDASVGGKDYLTAKSSGPLARSLMTDVPGVERAGRIRVVGDHAIRYGEHSFNEYRLYVADSTIFDIFSFSIVEGDRAAFLTQPGTVVITDAIAHKYFGEAPALGKTLTMDGSTPYMVCGVVKEFPRHSHWRFDLLVSSWPHAFDDENYWLGNSWYTYVLLKEGASQEQALRTFQVIVADHVRPILRAVFSPDWDGTESHGLHYQYNLQPLQQIHLYSHLDEELEPAGSITTVWMFIAIGAFILLIACVNFMNLSTARSAHRAKEVGVRKVLGSHRSQLIKLFLGEAILLTFGAMLVGIALLGAVLPSFNAFVGKNLSSADIGGPAVLAGLLLMVIVVGLMAGVYPAFVLSSFRPAAVLKGNVRSGMRGGAMRRILVVGQFAVSIMLMVGTIVVYRQLQFVNSRDLGFDKAQTLVVDNTWLLGSRSHTFRDLLLARPGIVAAAFTQNLPGNDINSGAYRPEGGDPSRLMMMRQLWADFEYLPTLGVRMREGRHFSRAFATDSTAVVINAAAARMLGYEHPVGRNVVGYFGTEERALKIIGVTEDFHYEPLHQPILPMVMLISRGYPTRLVIRVQGNVPSILRDVQNQWESFSGGQPFTSFFLDQRIERYYRRDQAVGTLFGILASLGFFISCLGLLGLAMYATEQRRKELGIRKVFGATASNLTGLLTREFITLVLIANLIAWPLGYLAMRRWLEEFAYRISLDAGIFLLAGAAALAVAMLAVAYHTIRAARGTPMESLRYE